ncbi:CvpA family protein [Ulvibacter antarcticus]|uniref:Membrane protein required for colicin V production n=1 Tax=Ulvibacter antarcticus TaxID=442714 RepID=A0A3L9Z6V2_9FLAO|nr:CvpA family protein [Ulvibacter antarcticus]RMA66138.1 membrane protein required for colicin V production [Ulvibacter antarcticus]
MSAVDIVLGVILLFSFYTGWKKGLFVALASLVGLIAGVYGAIYFSHFAGAYLAKSFDWSEQTLNLAAFAVTFLIIIFVVSLAGKLLTKIADFAALGFINKILGGVFNVLKFAFIISVIFMFINASTDISGMIISEDKKADSVLYEPVASIAPIFLPNLLSEVDKLRNIEPEEDQDATPSEATAIKDSIN